MDEKYRPEKAKVMGEGRRNGMTPNDIPDGYISWEEHYMAWHRWNLRHRDATTAEKIEREGGFNYRQLTELLGHTPVSWELQDKQRYAEFKLAPEDAPADLTGGYIEEPPARRSHIRNGVSDQSVCTIEDDAPDGLFYFDLTGGPNCDKCFSKMQTLMNNWVELGKLPSNG